MIEIIVVVHLIVAIVLILSILVQRSEGGIGMGSGSGGGLMSTRGSANLLTRITAGLATLFICTSLALAFLAGGWNRSSSIADEISATQPLAPSSSETTPSSGATTDSDNLLNSLDSNVPVE